MALSFHSTPGVDRTFSYDDAVKRFKARTLRTAKGKEKIGALRVLTLTDLCIQSVASGFEVFFDDEAMGKGGARNPMDVLEADFSKRPCNKYTREEIVRKVNENLPLDLDVTVAANYVTNDEYWKRRCVRQGWQNENPIYHGMTYKQ